MNDRRNEMAEKEKRYSETVKQIREKFFTLGKPYLILSTDLPEGESYWAFPDGRIEVQKVGIVDGKTVSTLIRVLSAGEAEKVRAENGL